MKQSGKKTSSKREELAKFRRNQVLDAARTCVIAEGIHGATINRICLEAGMGVGHLYKLFKSKDAIMVALTERDFDEFMLHLTPSDAQASLSIDAFISRILEDLPWLLDRDRATLAQEVMTESTRNSSIAMVITQIDRRFRGAIREIMEPAFGPASEDEIEGRVDTLLMVTRALSSHAALHPASNHRTLAIGIEVTLRALLSPISSRSTEMLDAVTAGITR